MRQADQDAAADQPDAYPADRTDPVIVDRIFYKEADRQHEDGDPDLADEVLTDKFFPVGRFNGRSLRL